MQQRKLRLAQCLRLALRGTPHPARIEVAHQPAGAGVVHIPQRRKHGFCFFLLRDHPQAVHLLAVPAGIVLRGAAGRKRQKLGPVETDGRVLGHLGQMRKALEYFTQALPILHKVGDRTDEANALENIGNAENELGDARGALRNEEARLSLAKAVENPDVQGGIDVSLMKYFRGQNRPEVAILFGMDAVNCYQQMRKNISGLGKDVQASFAQSKSSTYRQLAELLVQTDRLGEAEQVLDLLKEQELKEVVRGAAPMRRRSSSRSN